MPISKLEKCKKCDLPWIGLDKCACGWRPNAIRHYLLIIAIAASLLGTVGAIALCSHFYELFPDEKTAGEHVAKGEDELRRGNFSEAKDEFLIAAKYQPKSADIRRKIALALLNDDRLSQAAEQLRVARELAPSDSNLKREYAGMLEQTGKNAEAAQLFEEWAVDNPKDETAKFHLAEIYEKAGNTEKAQKLFSEFAQARPKLNGAWLAVARIQAGNGQKEEAILTLRQASEHLPDDGIVRQRLGLLLSETNNKEEAVQQLIRSAELEAGLAEYNSAVIANLSQGKQEEYVIPLRRQGNSFTVDAVLNDRTIAKLIVDTGAEVTAISPAIFKQLKISPANGSLIVMQGVGGAALSRKISLQSVRVGLAKQLLIPTAVMPAGADFDGLLGMSFLSRYQFSIDGRKNVLILRRK
jgi:clan AA aspartic protease (TIGR02281 family)